MDVLDPNESRWIVAKRKRRYFVCYEWLTNYGAAAQSILTYLTIDICGQRKNVSVAIARVLGGEEETSFSPYGYEV